jgi:diguanylate cyclase (GGDEF)-like protein
MVTPADYRGQTPGAASVLGARRALLLVGAIAALLCGGYAAAWLWGDDAERLARLLPLAILGSAAIVLWAVGRAAAGGEGKPWAALAAGLTLWVGAAGFTELTPHLALPTSTLISPLLTMGAGICWIAALLLMNKGRQMQLTITRLLDAVLVLGAAITVAGNSVLAPLWQDEATALFPFGQAVGGLLLFATLVVLRYTIAEPLPAADALAFGGLLLALVSESWLLWSRHGLLADAEPVLGALRLGAGLLFLLAAYEARFAAAAPRQARWDLLAHWLPLAGLSFVSGLLVLHFSGFPLPDLIFGAAISSLSLAVLRLGVALGENHRLRQEQTHLRLQNEEYIRLAISDPLTGLFNQGYFTYRLHEECSRSARYQHALTLVALDLDNFKQVNDRYGHAAGDDLLVAIGHALHAASRGADAPCRRGGDEFMLILPQTPVEQGLRVAERLRGAVNGVLRLRGLSPMVSISVGVAGYSAGDTSAADLAQRADQALYCAKQAGKNRCVVWTPDLAHPSRPAHHPIRY